MRVAMKISSFFDSPELAAFFFDSTTCTNVLNSTDEMENATEQPITQDYLQNGPNLAEKELLLRHSMNDKTLKLL